VAVDGCRVNVPWLVAAVAAFAVVVGADFWAETSEAAEVTFDPVEGATFDAHPAEQNRLRIKGRDGQISLRDAGAAITLARDAADGCAQPTVNEVVCTMADVRLVLFFEAHLGDGDDTARASGTEDALSVSLDGGRGDDLLSATSGSVEIAGGPGNDRLTSGDGSLDSLSGGSGADRLTAGAGYDSLDGGPGPDLLQGQGDGDGLDGGPGRDDLRGGSGVDTADYLVGRGPVTVTLDGLANDGEAGERDVIHRDIEGASVSAEGQSGELDAARPSGSKLIGNNGPNELSVFANATAEGRGGNDRLEGRWGLLLGGRGADTLTAWGPGRFHGGPDDDTLTKLEGGAGDARLYGDTGDDMVVSAEPQQCDPIARTSLPLGTMDCSPIVPLRDWVRCGAGRDTVIPDGKDVVTPDCERRRRPPPAARLSRLGTASQRGGATAHRG
jgi:hypothetical protein